MKGFLHLFFYLMLSLIQRQIASGKNPRIFGGVRIKLVWSLLIKYFCFRRVLHNGTLSSNLWIFKFLYKIILKKHENQSECSDSWPMGVSRSIFRADQSDRSFVKCWFFLFPLEWGNVSHVKGIIHFDGKSVVLARGSNPRMHDILFINLLEHCSIRTFGSFR